MSGIKRMCLVCLVAIFYTGIQTSKAQDVHVFLAAEHVRTITEQYLSPSGGTLGLRFPVKRLAVELALSHASFGSFPTLEVDKRTTYTAAVLYAIPLNDSWNFEAGISAGYGSRYISRIDARNFTIDRPFMPMSSVIAIRHVRGQWVQPFLMIQPTYDHLLQEIAPRYIMGSTDGIWAMVIRAGVSFALPTVQDQRRETW